MAMLLCQRVQTGFLKAQDLKGLVPSPKAGFCGDWLMLAGISRNSAKLLADSSAKGSVRFESDFHPWGSANQTVLRWHQFQSSHPLASWRIKGSRFKPKNRWYFGGAWAAAHEEGTVMVGRFLKQDAVHQWISSRENWNRKQRCSLPKSRLFRFALLPSTRILKGQLETNPSSSDWTWRGWIPPQGCLEWNHWQPTCILYLYVYTYTYIYIHTIICIYI